MTNDYKNEISNLIKVITNLEDTIQASCEIFVEVNKDKFAYKHWLETITANKSLINELERTKNSLAQMEIINQSLSDDLESYKSNDNSQFETIELPLDLHGLKLNENTPSPLRRLTRVEQQAQHNFINKYTTESINNKFSPRTNRILKEANIHTISELAAKKDSELLSLKGFGLKCLKEVRIYLGV